MQPGSNFVAPLSLPGCGPAARVRLCTPRSALTFRGANAQAVTETTETGQRVVCGPRGCPRGGVHGQFRRDSCGTANRIPSAGRRRLDQLAASESVSFPELVWAHYLHQRELHDEGELHGPAEEEYRSQLDAVRGRERADRQRLLVHRLKPRPSRSPRSRANACSGSSGANAPNIRLHAATDWATRDAPEINHALHTCRDPRDPRQRGPLRYERADRDAVAALDRRLSAECRRRSRGEDEQARARQGVEPGARRARARSSTTTTGPERRPAGSSTSGGC